MIQLACLECLENYAPLKIKITLSYYRNLRHDTIIPPEPKTPPSGPSKIGLSGLLLSDLLAIPNSLDPISEPPSTLTLLPFTKKLFKLFMQTYIDTVKNPTQPQAEIQAQVQT